MSEIEDKNILYGGPLPSSIDDKSQSLGEIVLKLLAKKENQNDLMFVSRKILWKCFIQQIITQWTKNFISLFVNLRLMDPKTWS